MQVTFALGKWKLGKQINVAAQRTEIRGSGERRDEHEKQGFPENKRKKYGECKGESERRKGTLNKSQLVCGRRG